MVDLRAIGKRALAVDVAYVGAAAGAAAAAYAIAGRSVLAAVLVGGLVLGVGYLRAPCCKACGDREHDVAVAPNPPPADEPAPRVNFSSIGRRSA